MQNNCYDEPAFSARLSRTEGAPKLATQRPPEGAKRRSHPVTNSIGVANQGKSLSNAEQKRHLQDGSMVAHSGDGENKTTIAP